MDLGVFSVSLAAKDISASRAFYEAIGFRAIDDHESDGWIIVQNGEARIGLFPGMFEQNILTFNPTDVRFVQRAAKEAGLAFMTEADESTAGPAAAMLLDPDGNAILIDQHDPACVPTQPGA